MMAYSFVCRRSRITNKNCLPWLQQSTIPLSSSSSPPPSLPSLCKWWKCKTEPKYVLLQSVHFCRLENSVSYPVHVMPSIQLMCVWLENPVCVFSLPHPLFLSRSIILTPPQHPRIVCECAKSTGIIAMHQQQTCYANQLKANKQSNDDITCLLSRYPHSNINSWTIRYAKHGRKYANISTRTIHTHTHILLKHMTISESHTHSLFTPYDRTMWYSVGINVLVEEDWINWLQMWASERLEPVRLKLFARVPLLTSDVPTENSSHFHCWLFTVKSNPLPSPPRHTHTHTHINSFIRLS